MAGDVRTGRVDDVSQVDLGEELLDQLLAELPLHERIGRDHADVARRGTLFILVGTNAFTLADCQIPESLSERHAERVLPVTRRIDLPIAVVLRLVLYGDVRRVADHDVEAPVEDFVRRGRILDAEFVGQVEVEFLLKQNAVSFDAEGRFAPTKQAVADGEVEFPGVALLVEAMDAAGAHRGHEHAEPRDGDGEGVEVHAEDAVERILGRDNFVVHPVLGLHPFLE